MKKLKCELLDLCTYRLPDELMDEFLDALTEVKLRSGDRLIRYGQMDDNVYVIKSGILRYVYFDGGKEKTFGFGTSGNISIQYHCYYMRKPSFFQLESCGKSVVMKISKKQMEAFIARSHDFSRWVEVFDGLGFDSVFGGILLYERVRCKFFFVGLLFEKPLLPVKFSLNDYLINEGTVGTVWFRLVFLEIPMLGECG